MVADCSDSFIKAVDDLLSTMTDGEHERVLKTLENKNENDESLENLLDDVESLENLGLDVSYIRDVRRAINLPRPNDLQVSPALLIYGKTLQTELNKTGRAVVDLARMQNQRLSSKPPVTITKAVPPSATETQLASNLQQRLVSHVCPD